jgi:hypothetical protein
MRFALTENAWTAIKPMLPNRPRGLPWVSDRRVLNGICIVMGLLQALQSIWMHRPACNLNRS